MILFQDPLSTFISVKKEIYQISIGAFKFASWEVHSKCASSAGDPHEKFGRCPGASLLHFLPSETGTNIYESWTIKNCSWIQDEWRKNTQEP